MASATPRERGPRDYRPGPESAPSTETLYQRLFGDAASGDADEALDSDADAFLRARLDLARQVDVDLPDHPDHLEAWVAARAENVGHAFRRYLCERRNGAPRRFFRSRAHALHFLRVVAPTKLVDGAWLYGCVRHWHDTRIGDLIETYLEELGEGSGHHNHVAIYRRLLAEHECDDPGALPSDYFLQGATQLALGHLPERYAPEVLGYNLGYEQPPLHMLITSHELRELGIDATYFTLHVTVDNATSGHAVRAARAVTRALPLLADREVFWQRVRAGFALSELGPGAREMIEAFDLDKEVIRVLGAKVAAGHGMHSDRARIGGRTVNEWLQSPEHMPALLEALQRDGWIVRGEDPCRSRFWRVVAGESAPMQGVFTRYERQVLFEWILGDTGSPGHAGQSRWHPLPRRSASSPGMLTGHFSRPYGVADRQANGGMSDGARGLMADDEDQLIAMLERASDRDAAMRVLVPLLAPRAHTTPAGLLATRLYCRLFRGTPLARALDLENVSRRADTPRGEVRH